MASMGGLSKALVPLCLTLLWGCGGEDLSLPVDPGGPPSVDNSTIEADPTSIPAGTGSSTIRVTVRNAAGAAIEGAAVVLAVEGDGATLTQPSDPTASDGTATGTLRSTTPGEKVVSATVNGFYEVSGTATITVTAGPVASVRMEALEGEDQTAPVGSRVPVAPAVRVVDEQGAPAEGVRVTFAVIGGDGSVEGADRTTGADGVARVGSWTLGTSPGSNALEASAPSVAGSPVIFMAEATSLVGLIDRLGFVTQPHDAGTQERIRVRVALLDADGEVVPLSGIFIYLDLFPDGSDVPNNQLLRGEHFENTEDGIAEFEIRVEEEGRYRLEAQTDDLPELGPHGPEPYPRSELFSVD
jgi:hypothetical protein